MENIFSLSKLSSLFYHYRLLEFFSKIPLLQIPKTLSLARLSHRIFPLNTDSQSNVHKTPGHQVRYCL